MENLRDERQPEFEQLISDLADGSEEAAKRIVDLYSQNILRAVRKSLPRVIRTKVDSVDIFQSVWMSVLAKRTQLAQFDTPQRFVAYLTATARIKVLEKFRHFTNAKGNVRREQRMSDPIDPGNSTALTKAAIVDVRHPQAYAVAEAREAWEKIISNCDSRDQRIIELRLKGKTYEVIAKKLNISTRTIRRTLQRLLLVVPHE